MAKKYNSTIDIFEKLKRQKTFISKQNKIHQPFFQLGFDSNGAFLRVVNNKGKSIEAGYESFRLYGGAERELLKSFDAIRNRNSFRIDWDNPRDEVYLGENDHLLWQLKRCGNFVDQDFEPIRFSSGTAKLILLIESKGTALKSKIILADSSGAHIEKIVLLNEDHAFADGVIYTIPPLSENYKLIDSFRTALLTADMAEKYLSLFFSCFNNIYVRYNDCKVVTGEPKTTHPTLIIEKIDSDNALHLRISTSLPGFDPDFFDTYDVTRIAVINDLEKKITVSDIHYEEIYSGWKEIEKLLNKHRRALKNEAGFFIDDNLFIIDESLAKAFIHAELPHLIARFAVMGAEKLKTFKVRAVKPKLDLSLSHGIDFLEGDARLEIEGQYIPLFDALNQYKKNAYITLNDGVNAIVNQDYMNKLMRIFNNQGKKKDDKVKVSFFDLPIVEEMIDEKIAVSAFKQSRDIFLGFNNLSKSKPRFPKLNAQLRDYQKQGFKWVKYLNRHELGGCLADDMGLGKTVQAITMLASAYSHVGMKQKKPSLIVMPRSLLFNWENEIRKFRPQLTFAVYHGVNRDFAAAKANNLILTTYAMVRNDIEILRKEAFYYIILDESQHIKNLNSKISKAVMLLTSEHRLALSGTPVENNLGELYALFRFLNPSMFGSVQDFNRNYAAPIQKNDDKDALHDLKKKIYPFILRRLKGEVLKDLPDKVEQTLYVDMSDEQKLLYEQRRRFYYETVKAQIAQNGIRKSQFFILQALSELRQIAAIPESKSENGIISPKRDVLSEYFIDLAANNHKMLVFANFLNALDCVADDLEQAGIQYLLMTGATRDREGLVRRFQEDENIKVFLMTLKTGGLGLNLTAADYIFIFDPWWNRSAENQAVDRTHRIGQKKTVFAYRLITRGTIEEKIIRLQEQKSELFDSLISSDGASIKSMSEKDVEFVLGTS
ncbi:DEAD/DEAH box helicase [Desulfococcaceae bacterium HSG9]|nr:DEAD/DEAH box helicase [Desulfococcaceae bacterium HSG9]